MKRTTIRSLKPSETDPPGEPKRYPLGKEGYTRLRWKIAPYTYVERYERTDKGEIARAAPFSDRWLDYKEIVRLHEEGLSQPQIAKRVGTNAGNVSRALKRMNISARSQYDYLVLPDDKEIIRLYTVERLGIDEVARRLGCSQGHVGTVLKKRRAARSVGRPPKKKTGKTWEEMSYETQLNLITPSLRTRSGGNCEVTASAKCNGRATHRHHRKTRSQGGLNELSNLLDCCIYCHSVIHLIGKDSYQNGWLVHSYDDPAQVAVIKGRKTYGRNTRLD